MVRLCYHFLLSILSDRFADLDPSAEIYLHAGMQLDSALCNCKYATIHLFHLGWGDPPRHTGWEEEGDAWLSSYKTLWSLLDWWPWHPMNVSWLPLSKRPSSGQKALKGTVACTSRFELVIIHIPINYSYSEKKYFKKICRKQPNPVYVMMIYHLHGLILVFYIYQFITLLTGPTSCQNFYQELCMQEQ